MLVFLNEQHKKNFEETEKKWELTKKGDREYVSACYILAIPSLFEKFNLSTMNKPISWIMDWEYKYNDEVASEYDLEESERKSIVIGYDLTRSMVELGRLALNLWNGYKFFNLCSCLSSLDEENTQAALYAIKFRFDISN